MKKPAPRQPHRLSADKSHAFHGSAIDRSRPLRFTLDGRVVEGYAGDTVLSALLACGIVAAGTAGGQLLALDEHFGPSVVPVALKGDPRRALPMDRMPAADGLELETLGVRETRHGFGAFAGRVNALLRGPSRSLGLVYDGGGVAGPWIDARPELTLKADLVVVGGGVAGLRAAQVAAAAGDRVILAERRPFLGGDARYFGAVGDEEPPAVVIDRLRDALAALSNVTVLNRTEVFAVVGGGVRAQQVDGLAGKAIGRVVDLKAPRIVLATGCRERLPLFPGNRLPGVVGTMAAFHRADRYGVWIGRSALVSTGSSYAYRLAMQASEAGIAPLRVADTRLEPQSRFIEFSKAYGIPRAPGVIVADAVRPEGEKDGLMVRFAVAFEEERLQGEPQRTEQLLVCGGWQPDLALWHMAGGACTWNAASGRLDARGALPGVALAGSAAGYQNLSACLLSGEAAVSELFDRKWVGPIADPQIEAIYESPDAPAPVAPPGGPDAAPTYLDAGHGLLVRPRPVPAPRWRVWSRSQPAPPLVDDPRPIGVGDLAAAIQLGEIPAEEAAAIAAERGVVPFDLAETGRERPFSRPRYAAPASPVPPYLAGRYGSEARLWQISAEDQRSFEPGCLVYVNTDSAHPRHAVGVVVGKAGDGRHNLALIGKTPLASGDRLVVKDLSGSVPVHLTALVEDAPAPEAAAPPPP